MERIKFLKDFEYLLQDLFNKGLVWEGDLSKLPKNSFRSFERILDEVLLELCTASPYFSINTYSLNVSEENVGKVKEILKNFFLQTEMKDLIQNAADLYEQMQKELKKTINEKIEELAKQCWEVIEKYYQDIYIKLNIVVQELERKLKTIIPDIKVWINTEFWSLEIHSPEREACSFELRRRGYKYSLALYVYEFLRERVKLKGLKVGLLHSTYINDEELERIRELLDEWWNMDEVSYSMQDIDWYEVRRDIPASVLHEFYIADLFREKMENKNPQGKEEGNKNER